MGQKVNPISLRIGINRTWESRWYSKKDYAKNLHEDLKIRSYIKKRLKNGEVSRVEIIRYPEKINVIVHTARPGIVIGRKGAEVENISKELSTFSDKNNTAANAAIYKYIVSIFGCYFNSLCCYILTVGTTISPIDLFK